MPRPTVDLVEAAMRDLHGVATVETATRLGLTRGQLRHAHESGRWLRPSPRVLLSAAAPPTWHQDVAVASLTMDGLASHRTAARLWALDGIRTSSVEIVVPHGRYRRRPSEIVVHQTLRFDLTCPTVRDSIPTTGIECTILDLAAVVSRHRLGQAADDAVRRELTDWAKLAHHLFARAQRGRPGIRAARAMIGERSDGRMPRSDWSRLVATLLVESGVHRPELEYPVTTDDGVTFHLDLAYPAERVGIELQSVTHHVSKYALENDARRRNLLLLAGWTVLEFTWADYKGAPERLVQSVRAARRSKASTTWRDSGW